MEVLGTIHGASGPSPSMRCKVWFKAKKSNNAVNLVMRNAVVLCCLFGFNRRRFEYKRAETSVCQTAVVEALDTAAPSAALHAKPFVAIIRFHSSPSSC